MRIGRHGGLRRHEAARWTGKVSAPYPEWRTDFTLGSWKVLSRPRKRRNLDTNLAPGSLTACRRPCGVASPWITLMALSLEQYAHYLDTRGLPWPAPPEVERPK